MTAGQKATSKPFGFRPEFIAEDQTSLDGGSLLRFTFDVNPAEDLSSDFHRYVTSHLSKTNYDHITIHCPNGHPAWLTKFFMDLNAYGLPVEVTPEPTDSALVAAIAGASRHTPFKWQEGLED